MEGGVWWCVWSVREGGVCKGGVYGDWRGGGWICESYYYYSCECVIVNASVLILEVLKTFIFGDNYSYSVYIANYKYNLMIFITF